MNVWLPFLSLAGVTVSFAGSLTSTLTKALEAHCDPGGTTRPA